jgi:hypothetical protein
MVENKPKSPSMHPIILYDLIKLLRDAGSVRTEDLTALIQKHEKINSETECAKLTKEVKLTWMDMTLV